MLLTHASNVQQRDKTVKKEAGTFQKMEQFPLSLSLCRDFDGFAFVLFQHLRDLVRRALDLFDRHVVI